jgi:hypothetical protein
MAETLVKEKVCRACGADVRPRALFCYNCGSAVAPDAPLPEGRKKSKSGNWYNSETAGQDPAPAVSKKSGRRSKPAAAQKADPEIEDAAVAAPAGDEKKAVDEKSGKSDLKRLDSAANLRRRGRSIQKKRVEIIWEEHDNAPNGWFILVAVLLTLLAVAIWLVARYLE